MMFYYCFVFFFFKQKTAYEMRISDWSSDVCSSDLAGLAVIGDILRVGQILDGEAQGAEAGLVAGIEVEQRVAVEIGGIEAGCVLEIAIEKSRRLQAQRESIARPAGVEVEAVGADIDRVENGVAAAVIAGITLALQD